MRDKREKSQPEKIREEQEKNRSREQHSSAFREPKEQEQKSTVNTEEADLEQERKEAMSERD